MEGSAAADSISVNQWNLEALSVNSKHIQPDSIATGMIQVGSVGSDELAAGAVGTTTIADGAINTDKLQALAVTAAKIAGDTITSSQLATNAITSAEITAGAVTSGKISVSNLADINTLFAGSITISAAAGGGEPSTGVYITSTRIKMLQSSVVKVDINAATGYYYFKGELHCTKITVDSNADNSVNFGSSITVGGNIIINTSSVDGRIYFDGSGGYSYIDYDSSIGGYPLMGTVFNRSSGAVGMVMGTADWTEMSGAPSIYIQDGSIYLQGSGSYGPNTTTRDVNIKIGTNSGNRFSLQRGSSETIWVDGNSELVKFSGGIMVDADSTVGIVYFGNSGDNYLLDASGHLYWYSSAHSGGVHIG